MKNTFILLILLIIVNGCTTTSIKSNNYIGESIILKGEVKNSKSSFLVLRNNFWEPLDTIQLVGERFREILNLPDSYYYIDNDQADIKIYLKSGMDLELSYDSSDAINTTVFNGKGQTENNYLAAKSKLRNDIPREKRSYTEYSKLNENEFLAQTDSIYQLNLNLIQKTKNLEETFYYLEKNSIAIENAIRIVQFEGQKQLVTNDPSFRVSENYPNAFVNLDLNNALLMRTYRYKDIMNQYVSSLVKNSKDFTDTSDFFLLFQKELANSNLKSEIRDKLGLTNSEYGFTHTQDKEKYYNEYMSFATIDEYRKKFQERYNLVLMEKGNPSPNFKFIGIDNKWHSLEDYRGKYIYIDLWASWCTPCIAEVPQLKKLEEKYANKINFVSIAWNDNETSWKQMISNQNMVENQLYASNKDEEFFKFYNVKSIPRFILLDKKGNIIESSAKQPSDKSLSKQFDELE